MANVLIQTPYHLARSCYCSNMATESELASFLDRQTILLKRERDAEIERTSLLLSSCSPKLLERKGLSLGALGVASIRIGLGGKRFAILAPLLYMLIISWCLQLQSRRA